MASVAAGLLLIAGFGLHPAREDPTFATDELWIPAHSLLWLAFTIAPLGWIALRLAQGPRARRLGILALVVISPGTSLASWIFSSDVTFVPVIAPPSPSLFEAIYSGAQLLIGVSSVWAWVVGVALFGISVVRGKVFSQWAGIFVVIGTLIILIAHAAGLSVRIVGLGGAMAGAGQIWLGSALLRRLSPG
ncbi:MAG TPA: hypothetical protein VFG86_27230 [Chloroflexota bacterium]|nr:hypothetical protein [Chloroflexota bacterium]